LRASPQESRKSRNDELIAGWKALKQALPRQFKGWFFKQRMKTVRFKFILSNKADE
jgi:hypothetical protein